jgi:hypothetical protein
MLDAHPQLAIPPETMLQGVFRFARQAPPPDLPRAILDAMMRSQRWADLEISADDLLDAFNRAGDRFSISEGLRIFYRLYAAKQGKSRFGDKTPGHIFWISDIVALLPETRIIHLVRDGRDVAASMRGLWFGPGDNMPKLAESWLTSLAAGFESAKAHPDRYLEVRYEDLVASPEPTLRRVLAAIDLPFDSAVLRHYERAADRLLELGQLRDADGGLFATREAHQAIHRRTVEPPNTDQVGRFRQDLSHDERTAFEAEAGPMLAKLEYIA